VQLGWKMDEVPPYELRPYEGEEQRIQARQAIDNSDVVILGSAPDALIVDRLKKKKLTFKYAERFYKTGTPLKRFLRRYLSAFPG